MSAGCLSVYHLMSEFRCHVDFSFEFGKSFSGKFFIGYRAIDDSRVKKSHSTFYSFVQKAYTRFLVRMLAAVVSHTHNPEPES